MTRISITTALTTTTRMSFPLTFSLYLATAASLVSSANAQITYRNRRPSIGRVVAGAVVGSVCGILLLCCLCIMLKKRRRAANNPVAAGGNSTFMSKPLFGGPFGRRKQQQQQQQHQQLQQQQQQQVPIQNQGMTSQHQGNPYWNTNNQPVQNVQQGHESAAPPYSGPVGDAHDQQQYAPPLGPPPPAQAHMKGDDREGKNQNGFVGGFNPRN